jgi:hypothetical protein
MIHNSMKWLFGLIVVFVSFIQQCTGNLCQRYEKIVGMKYKDSNAIAPLKGYGTRKAASSLTSMIRNV